MKPNNDANNENIGSPSPSFLKNMGRLANLPRQERISIARKGGLAKSEKKKLSSQLNPIKTGSATTVFNIAKCDECPIKSVCNLYNPNSACQIELNIRRNLIRQFKAFVGDKPEAMLMEIMKKYQKLEDMVKDDPSFYKLTQQIYMLLNIYKMKFGERVFVTKTDTTMNNPSEEIKDMIKEIREGGRI